MDIGAFFNQYKWIIDTIAYIIATASVIVKITPTQRDDAFILPIIKFIGKFLALDKYSPPERPK